MYFTFPSSDTLSRAGSLSIPLDVNFWFRAEASHNLLIDVSIIIAGSLNYSLQVTICL